MVFFKGLALHPGKLMEYCNMEFAGFHAGVDVLFFKDHANTVGFQCSATKFLRNSDSENEKK